jgi:NAD(P) transhydrogenase subunit alpha
MTGNIVALLYLAAGVLFILALRGLSNPETSRQGNRFGMIGMAIAVATTLAASPPAGPIGWALVLGGIAVGGAIDRFVFRLSILVLAIFVGYYVVWSVTPALHTPLMSVTNAISSVIVVGALLAVGVDLVGEPGAGAARTFGFIALVLASVNIFGGFLVTQRMLGMYQKKK